MAEEYRGSGVGRQLFDALGAHAHKRGISHGFAVTNVSNRDAMELFDKVGGAPRRQTTTSSSPSASEGRASTLLGDV